MQRRTLVTGATGFLGRHLLRALIGQGGDPVALLREAQPGIASVIADVTDYAGVAAAMRKVAPDIVFHLAADTSVRRFDGSWSAVDAALQTNLQGTLNVVRAAEEQGSVRIVVRTGGLEEYGASPLPSIEGQREAPTSPYSASQAAATMWCQMMQPSLRTTIVTLRPALTYGPGQRETFLIPALIRSLLDARPFIVRTGNHRRDYVYVDDVIDALLSVAGLDQRVRGEVVNIASGQALKIASVAAHVAHLLERPELLTIDADDPFARNPEVIWGDAGHASRLMGWAPQIGLDEGLRRTIDSYR